MDEKINLCIYERFALIDFLPKQGNIKELESMSALKQKLWFNEKEREEFGVVQLGPNKFDWDHTKDQEVTFEIPNFVIDKIVDKLVFLDNESKLEERHVALYKRFVTI